MRTDRLTSSAPSGQVVAPDQQPATPQQGQSAQVAASAAQAALSASTRRPNPTAPTTGTQPRRSRQLTKATSAATEPRPVVTGSWPSGTVDWGPYLAAAQPVSYAAAAARAVVQGSAGSGRAPGGLSTIGRPLPPIIPQTVGRDFDKPIGNWPGDLKTLASDITANLQKLAGMAEGRNRKQLHLEITLNWHCLPEVGKRNLLETLATRHAGLLGDVSKPSTDESARTPVRDWLEHSVGLGASGEEAKRLLQNMSPAARKTLAKPFEVAGSDEAGKMLRTRFASLRFEQAMNDGVDYGGFMERTNRVYAKLPKEKLGMKVIVIGGGPTGIVAADGLNRMGAKPLVLEQGLQIGGRIKTMRPTRADGTASPSKIEGGAMRANFHAGNPLTYLVKRYGIETAKFPNPGDVDTVFQIGNKVHFVKQGDKPTDPLMRRVDEGYDKHVEQALFDPIRRARDAGDTAKFYQLTSALEKAADEKNFRGFVRDAFEQAGVQMTPKMQDMMDYRGIGVGGYKGYNNIAASEEARFTIDERVENHRFIPAGFDTPFRKMVEDDELVPGHKGGKLPNGEDYQSLKKLDAIRTGAEVTAAPVKLKDGTWEVHYTDKMTGEKKVEKADDVIWAAPPGEAKRLGITDAYPHVPDDLAFAIEKANLVGATKMAVKIPAKVFDDFAKKGIDLNVNLQSSKMFQQAYVLPPYPAETTPTGETTGPAQSRVMFISYTLGDNSVKESGLSKKEKFDVYRSEMASAEHAKGDEQGKLILKSLAEALGHVDEKDIFLEPWSLNKHFYAAFKMDAAGDKANTQKMTDSVLKGSDMDGLIIGNEHMTFESGFARGAVKMGIEMVQKLAVRHGGELPPNSPFEQRRLDNVAVER